MSELWSGKKSIPFSVRYGCISTEDGVTFYSYTDIANNNADQVPQITYERVVNEAQVEKIKESYKTTFDLLAIY